MEKKFNLDNWKKWSEEDFISFKRYIMATFAGCGRVPLSIIEDPNDKFTDEDINKYKKCCKILWKIYKVKSKNHILPCNQQLLSCKHFLI